MQSNKIKSIDSIFHTTETQVTEIFFKAMAPVVIKSSDSLGALNFKVQLGMVLLYPIVQF